MKKNLFLALALAAPVMAGVDAPVVVAPNPEIIAAPAPAVSPWALEIGAVYRWAGKDICKDFSEFGEIDLWGADLTLIHKVDDNHSFNLRFGYNYGDKTETSYYFLGQNEYDKDDIKVEVHSFYIMPGYRYTAAVCDTVSLYAGANVGVSNMKVKFEDDYQYVYNGVVEDSWSGSTSEKDWGFAASAEVGIQYHISDSAYLYAAYQFWMSTAQPKYTDVDGFSIKAEKQHYHSVTAGIGINF